MAGLTLGPARPAEATAAAGRADQRDPADVLKLDPTGGALVYSTYLGGSIPASGGPSNDSGTAIAIASSGNATVVGSTHTNDFPTTTGALDRSFNLPASGNPTSGGEAGVDMAATSESEGVDSSTLMHIQSVLAGWSRGTGKGKIGYARVQINDQFDVGVPDATVTGDFTGCFSIQNASGVTDSTGIAYIPGKKFVCPSTNCYIVFTVDNVSHVLATYDPEANVMDSGSITCDSRP